MNSLHPLSTSSFIARHLLITKITEADAQTICPDATPSGLSVPHLHHPSVFTPNGLSAATLPIYPGLGQPPNNAGLHTQWRGFTHWTQVTSSDRTSPSLSTVLKKLNPTINKLFSASCGGCKHDTARICCCGYGSKGSCACCRHTTQQSINIAFLQGPQQQTRHTLLQRSIDGQRDRQTDGFTDCAPHYYTSEQKQNITKNNQS